MNEELFEREIGFHYQLQHQIPDGQINGNDEEEE